MTRKLDGPHMIDRRLTGAAAALASLAVVLGAFGTHILKARVGTEALGWWQTGIEYQMWHALAALVLGLSGMTWSRLPAWLLLAGAVAFSVTLYAMALGAPRWLGAVTPVGGLAMISGWGLLVWRASRRSRGD